MTQTTTAVSGGSDFYAAQESALVAQAVRSITELPYAERVLAQLIGRFLDGAANDFAAQLMPEAGRDRAGAAPTSLDVTVPMYVALARLYGRLPSYPASPMVVARLALAQTQK